MTADLCVGALTILFDTYILGGSLAFALKNTRHRWEWREIVIIRPAGLSRLNDAKLLSFASHRKLGG